RGPIRKDTGPMSSVLSRILVSGGAEPAASSPMVGPMASAGTGTVTWVTGSNWTQAAQSAIAANTDYLMIMADALSDSLVGELATKRATFNGLNVSIVKMSQIDANPDTTTTPNTIRALIKTVYDSRSAGHASDS
ncbi:MAG: hypothetical protein ACE5FA_12375, partial [Dehalococcoidia bacterium]